MQVNMSSSKSAYFSKTELKKFSPLDSALNLKNKKKTFLIYDLMLHQNH